MSELEQLPIINLGEVYLPEIKGVHRQRDLVIADVHKYPFVDRDDLWEFRVLPEAGVPGMRPLDQTGFLRERRGSATFDRLHHLYSQGRRFRVEGVARRPTID